MGFQLSMDEWMNGMEDEGGNGGELMKGIEGRMDERDGRIERDEWMKGVKG